MRCCAIPKKWFWGCVAILCCAVGAPVSSPGGEVTIDGHLSVKTNLVVQGQLIAGTLIMTNLSVSGTTLVEHAIIREVIPQGDLSMGPYTNRAVGGN